MSGRDMRSFVLNHRHDETDKLVLRVKEGLPTSKYKEVDYAALKALTAEKKFKGQEKLVKVKKLQQVSKQGKEQNLLKQHHMVWKKEFNHLNHQRNQIQAEIDQHVRQNAESDLLSRIYADFENYENKLERDLIKFRDGTTSAVWNLRDDLKIWSQELMSHGMSPDLDDPRSVRGTIASIQAQQHRILEKLQHEQNILEDELQTGDLPISNNSHLPPERTIETGIPEEAFDLDCPDLDLKASILQEFILLDTRYIERLDELQEQHKEAIESETGYWSVDDHSMFLNIVDQYTHDVPNRRMMYIDRLKRHLPHMNRSHIVNHEEWWLLYRYYFKRRRDLISDWCRDRLELLNKTKVVFNEAVMAEDLALQQEEYRQKQQQLCDALYAKVEEWRLQKLEAMQLEQEHLQEQHQCNLQRLRAEEEKEKQRRDKEKDKIQNFKEEKAVFQQRQDAKKQARLAELKTQLEEQARYDQKREKYRQEELAKKLESQLQKKQEEQLAAEEREEVLEKIREKVRPHVSADLLRLWSETEVRKARLLGQDEDINIQKPLFEINTFSAKTIAADPRFQLVERLHAAGLTHNLYAQQALATVQPLHPPRRDMHSTLFK